MWHLAVARARCGFAGVSSTETEDEARHFAALAERSDSQYLCPDSVGANRDTGPLLLRRNMSALAVYSTEAAAVELELGRGSLEPPEALVWPGVSHDFPVQRPGMFAGLVSDWARGVFESH